MRNPKAQEPKIVRRWARIAFFSSCLLLAVLWPGESCARTVDDPGAAVDRIFSEWTDSGSPGAAVAVVRDGRVVFSRGYGLANLEYRVPVTPGTAFDLGSITKQFTAFAIAELVKQGKLSLDDDVRKYIPEMKVRGARIRIRHLIDHTSGLRDEFNLLTMEGYGIDDAITFGHSLRLITSQEELLFEPGERWEYCNSGYTLLAEIISRVTGKPYATWMKENVFIPLGMARTGFPEDAGTIIDGRAYSYLGGSHGWRKAVISKSSLGCSRLFSTAEDLARWAINFSNAKIGGRAVIDMMGDPGVLNDGTVTDYAFGQFVGEYRGSRTFSHDGGIGGFRTALIRFPDQRVAVVVLANADHFRAMALARQVADLYLGDLPSESTTSKKPVTAEQSVAGDPVELKDCVGSYRLESTGKVLKVVLEDERLSLLNLATGGKSLTLSRSNGNDFTVDGMGLKISFVENEAGAVDHLILHVGDPPQEAKRISEVTMTEAELARFAGNYLSGELLVVYSLEVRGGVLVASHSRLPPAVLTPTGEYEFSTDKPWLRVVRFELDDHGRPVGFRADAAYAKNVLFKRVR